MIELRGIISVGRDETRVERQSRPVFELRGRCGVVTIQRMIGLDCDPLCVEAAIDEACAMGRPLVLRFRSRGGCLDDVTECLIPAIRRARIACGIVAGFLETCHGAAYVLATECRPIVASRSATIGHFALRASSRGRGSGRVVAELQEQVWARIRERRPTVTQETLERFAGRSMSAELAEACGVIDGIASLPRDVTGHV